VLNVPEDVEVRKVDLAVELQVLAFHEQRRRQPDGSVVTRLEPAAPPTDQTSTGQASEVMNA
ncbi:MAG: redox-sensing transcriptional repressor Rex, partial [Actinomycetota bacterium]|nr:redox-sensing transcriptional repressor Rex [Actinomycetota bacterium]